jgi:acetylornithine/N-succinyldiaminopimelate aminotransferase
MGPGSHGSTFGGNPVCCAGALVVLDRISADGFLDSVTEKGNYIKETVKAWNLPFIKEVRGKGLFIGIDIGSLDPKAVVKKTVSKGLLILSAGKSAIRLLPPLVITKEEIDKGLSILHDILLEVGSNV